MWPQMMVLAITQIFVLTVIRLLLLEMMASVPMLVWHIPNFSISFLLKVHVVGESTFTVEPLLTDTPE